jgi:hypothetical protein
MKILRIASFILLAFIGLAGCHQASLKQTDAKVEIAMAATGNFGEQITAEGALPATEVAGLFTQGDSTTAKISGHIVGSCKHSGCWMEVDMGNQSSVHVTFKDEAFTIPLDAAGKNAVMKGMAYRQSIPVETLQDYAREDGKSEEEIAAITLPAWEYEFVATGVIISE